MGDTPDAPPPGQGRPATAAPERLGRKRKLNRALRAISACSQALIRSSSAPTAYRVVGASNGVEALAKARQAPPALVVTDILMPVMDGFSLCREWKQDERLKAVPLVFYTATYTDDRDRDLALSLGAERFRVKPESGDAGSRRPYPRVEEGSQRAAGQGRPAAAASDGGGMSHGVNAAMARHGEARQ